MEPEKPKLDYASPKHDENRPARLPRLFLMGLLGSVAGCVLTIAGVKIFITFHPVRGAVVIEELLFAAAAVGNICGVVWGLTRDNSKRG